MRKVATRGHRAIGRHEMPTSVAVEVLRNHNLYNARKKKIKSVCFLAKTTFCFGNPLQEVLRETTMCKCRKKRRAVS